MAGKFCDLYKGEVEAALKKVAGVTTVDIKTGKGHALVTGEAGKVNGKALAAAVNALKGDNRHCTAEVVR